MIGLGLGAGGRHLEGGTVEDAGFSTGDGRERGPHFISHGRRKGKQNMYKEREMLRRKGGFGPLILFILFIHMFLRVSERLHKKARCTQCGCV